MARYSPTVMEHFSEPRNFGRMEGADFVGVAGVPGQGRYLVIYMKLESRRIAEATFHCHGCGATIACGSMLTEMMTGKLAKECREDIKVAGTNVAKDVHHQCTNCVE